MLSGHEKIMLAQSCRVKKYQCSLNCQLKIYWSKTSKVVRKCSVFMHIFEKKNCPKEFSIRTKLYPFIRFYNREIDVKELLSFVTITLLSPFNLNFFASYLP